MKRLMTSLCMVAVLGGLVGCESLPFLSAKNQLETVVGVAVSGTYSVSVSRNGQVVYTETWDCTKDPTSGKLTGCHKLAAVPSSGVVQ